MAFSPSAGQAANFRSVGVSPDLTKPVPTLTGLTTTSRAGTRKWDIDHKHDGPKSINFGSPVAANGTVYPQRLQGGTGEWSVTMEGEFDSDVTTGANTGVKLNPGDFVIFDLLTNITSTGGRYGCVGKVASFKHGADVTDTENPQMWTCEITGHGLLPAYGTGT